MTSAAAAPAKRIDPGDREIIRDLARRAGMTPLEWLNQVALEDRRVSEDEPWAGYPTFGRTAEPAQRLADEPARRLAEATAAPAAEPPEIAETSDRPPERLEASGQGATLALRSAAQSVAAMAARLEVSGREQAAATERVLAVVEVLQIEQSQLTARLQQIEETSDASFEERALSALTPALVALANRVHDGETRTGDALNGLRDELDGIQEQLSAVGDRSHEAVGEAIGPLAKGLELAAAVNERALGRLQNALGGFERRLQAAESRLAEQAAGGGSDQAPDRSEMERMIRERVDARFARIERVLQEMNASIQAAEQRSGDAAAQTAREVMGAADALSRKVEEVERGSADKIERLGGEIARLAETMETRLARADVAGAEALDRLGGEIGGIARDLTERMAELERRSAPAIEEDDDPPQPSPLAPLGDDGGVAAVTPVDELFGPPFDQPARPAEPEPAPGGSDGFEDDLFVAAEALSEIAPDPRAPAVERRTREFGRRVDDVWDDGDRAAWTFAAVEAIDRASAAAGPMADADGGDAAPAAAPARPSFGWLSRFARRPRSGTASTF